MSSVSLYAHAVKEERESLLAEWARRLKDTSAAREWMRESVKLVGRNVGRQAMPGPDSTFADVVDFLLSDPHCVGVIVPHYAHPDSDPGKLVCWFVYVDDNVVPQIMQLVREQIAPYTFAVQAGRDHVRRIRGGVRNMPPSLQSMLGSKSYDEAAYVYDTASERGTRHRLSDYA